MGGDQGPKATLEGVAMASKIYPDVKFKLFGDMTKSLTVCEPAVCISYIIQNSKKYSIDVEQFLEGYLSVYNLNKYELRCIPYLVCMRLSISVTMAAWRKKLFPKNKYLTISEKPAWSLIHLLKKVDLENWI